MFKEDNYYLGFVYKTHGIKGAIVLKTKYNFSKNEAEKMEWIFIDIDGILTPFFVEKIISCNEQNCLLKLEDINDDLAAKGIISSEIFIDKKTMEHLTIEDNYIDFTGFHVYNKALYVGEIRSVKSFPGQEMLEIDSGKRSAQTVLIPLTEQWLQEINKENKQLIFDLPDGLLDINDD